MSLIRPTEATVRDAGGLARVLGGFYDVLTALTRRTSVESLITVALLSGQDNRIPHGLPGSLSTWEIVDINADANVWRSATVNADRSVILLRASAAVTVRLRFA